MGRSGRMLFAGLCSVLFAAHCHAQDADGFQPAATNVLDASYPRVDGEGRVQEEAERLTPRHAAFLVMRRAEKLYEADQHRIDHLRRAHAELDEAVELGQSYLRIMRERASEEFDAWLEQASTSTLVSFLITTSGQDPGQNQADRGLLISLCDPRFGDGGREPPTCPCPCDPTSASGRTEREKDVTTP